MAWRRYVDEHPHGNIFHTPEMFQIYARAQGFLPSLWAVVDKDDQPLALLLPVKIKLLNGVMQYFTTRVVVYGSVLSAECTEGKNALKLLLRHYARESDNALLFTELRNVSDLSYLQTVLNECGFMYEDHLNYLIDLDRPPENILQSMGRRTRKHIRRSLRRGLVKIEEIKNVEQVATCYRLLQQSHQMAKIPLADLSLLETAFDLLYPKNMIRFTLACLENTPIATSAELLYKDVVYGWYSGMDREYGSYVPNELIMWDVLKWGADNGYTVYDFGGAGRPDEEYGVRDFKAKFGGDLVCYGRNTYVHAPFRFALSKTGYQIFRELNVFNK
jgi:lipid II:glycine glycyltransferase (peptidoglycan interpeptide bridge formation enzyme)